MQIKTKMRCHLTPVRMAIINKSTTNVQDVGKERRLMQQLWKTVRRFLKKLKMELPYDPVILLLEIYSKKHKTPLQKDTCIHMFPAVLFTIVKLWRQPRCP